MTAQEKFSRLVEFIYQYNDAAVAFSGGTKSSLLLCAAQEALGKDILALTANTAFMTQEVLYNVHEVLDDYKLRDARVPVFILENSKIADNGAERCHSCSGMISEELLRTAKGMGACVLLDGRTKGQTQVSCIREVDGEVPLVSPFVSLGYSDDDVCEMLRAVGRAYYIRKPWECMAGRFPLGEKLSAEKLDFLEEAEKFARGRIGGGVRIDCCGWNISVRSKKAPCKEAEEVIREKFLENGAKSVQFEVDFE